MSYPQRVQWDYVIIGSGFGGSVAGLRLVQKGYRVLMLEKGRRLRAEDFPKTNWNLRRWLWLPALGFRGLFRMTFLRHITALTGVGVGGGSLVYANTLPTPRRQFFESGQWAELGEWEKELGPHYQTAARMLGATQNPDETLPDVVLRRVSEQLGRADHFESTRVAVYFGERGKTVPDPYFDGAGPERTGCTRCGACMTGCRVGAKNTLDKNYLYLAEKLGLEIQAESEVRWVRPAPGGGYALTVSRHRAGSSGADVPIRARNVIFAGGVLGTVDLLTRLRESEQGLPKLSARVGDFVRTNSEVLLGVVSRRRDQDLSKGIAIGSILHTDEHSHVEPVRYASGSGFFRLLTGPHTYGSNIFSRLGRALAFVLKNPIRTVRWALVPNWARSTMILLYMRSSEGHLRLRQGRSLRTLFRKGLVSELGSGPSPTASIPEATAIGEMVANEIDGYPTSMTTETIWGTPTTAHILGGCAMGATAQDGVINARHEVFGYPGLMVVDGAAVSSNPGVNPSLTITALAERAMSLIPTAANSD